MTRPPSDRAAKRTTPEDRPVEGGLPPIFVSRTLESNAILVTLLPRLSAAGWRQL